MLKNQMLVVCLSVALLVTGAAIAGETGSQGSTVKHQMAAPPPPPPPPPPPIDAVAKYLALNEDQLGKWRDLQTEREEAMDQIAAKIRDLDDQLKAQMKSEDPVAAVVGDLMIQLKQARNEKGNAIKNFTERFRAILTPAQIEKIDAVGTANELTRWMYPLAETGFLAPPPPPPPPPHAPKAVPHAPAPPPPPPPPAPGE